MSQIVSRGCGYPVNEGFDTLDPDYLANPPYLRLSPPDQRFEFDPNMSFRGPKELWAEWTPARAGA